MVGPIYDTDRPSADAAIARSFSIPMHVIGFDEQRSCGACSLPLWWHDEQMMRACRRQFASITTRGWGPDEHEQSA